MVIRDVPTAEVADLLSRIAASGSPPLHQMGVDGARAATVSATRLLQQEGPQVDLVEEVNADGTRLRVYHPRRGELLSALIYLHGGGWVTGGLDAVDSPCRRLAVASGHVVISVDYRLSPEAPFPAALDDAETALRWVMNNRERLGVNAAPPVVMGDSAGGNLAAALALRTRTARGPVLGAQVLLYPVLSPETDSPYESYRRNADDLVLSRATMAWFWEQYLPRGVDPRNPEVSPLFAKDLSGLPPTLIVTAGLDVLMDEGIAYAEGLATQGVETRHIHYPGVTHGFFWMDRRIPEASRVVDEVRSFLLHSR